MKTCLGVPVWQEGGQGRDTALDDGQLQRCAGQDLLQQLPDAQQRHGTTEPATPACRTAGLAGEGVCTASLDQSDSALAANHLIPALALQCQLKAARRQWQRAKAPEAETIRRHA